MLDQCQLMNGLNPTYHISVESITSQLVKLDISISIKQSQG